MGAIIRFLRTHRWYRRLLTVSLTLVVGATAGILAYPYVSEQLLLRDLGSDDADVRRAAVDRAVARAQSSPRFARRLNAALADAGDEKFIAIAEVLKAVGKFYTQQRKGLDIDRLHAYEMATAVERLGGPEAMVRREAILRRTTLNRRDNTHVRRILASAAGDGNGRLREASAPLAALLGDDEVLSGLLSDDDAMVVSAAALSAGIAGRDGLFDTISALLEGGDVDKVSSAAYAAALLRPAATAGRICKLLAETDDPALRDRLLEVTSLLGEEQWRPVVLEILAKAREAGEYPPPMAVLAAAGAELSAEQKQQLLREVRGILAGDRNGGRRPRLVLAAMEAAERLEAEVLDQLMELWGQLRPPYSFPKVWVRVARLARLQAGRLNADDPKRKRVEQMLRDLAKYYDKNVSGPREFLTMPAASAAAAAALWQLRAEGADEIVRMVAGGGGRLAVDHISWHVGRRGGARARELAFRMLPQAGTKVHNDDVRAAGAMLMALAAETEEQREAAAGRIMERLTGGEYVPRVIDMFNCALLVLGRREKLDVVRAMLRRLPQRRALTALLAAGDRWALDWLLGGTLADGEIDYLLNDEGLAEVLAETAPGLPAAGVTSELSPWRVRIMRYYYLINRPRIQVGLNR